MFIHTCTHSRFEFGIRPGGVRWPRPPPRAEGESSKQPRWWVRGEGGRPPKRPLHVAQALALGYAPPVKDEDRDAPEPDLDRAPYAAGPDLEARASPPNQPGPENDVQCDVYAVFEQRFRRKC